MLVSYIDVYVDELSKEKDVPNFEFSRFYETLQGKLAMFTLQLLII